MIYFKKIEIFNFLSSAFNIIKFNNEGLVLIKGIDGQGNSNGTGKSLLLESIYFTLYGKTLRKINKIKDVIRKGQDKCRLILHFEKDKNKYILERKIEKVGEDRYNHLLILYDNNKKILHDNYKSVSNFIKKIIPENYFTSAVVFTRQLPNFVEMSDKEKKEFIVNYLNMNMLQKVIMITKEKYKKIKEEITDITQQIDMYNKVKKNLKETLDLSTTDKVKETLQLIQEYSNKIEKYKDLKIQYEKIINKIEKEVAKIKEEIKENQIILQKTNNIILMYEQQREQLNKIKSKKICPLCLRSMSKQEIKKTLIKLKNVLNLEELMNKKEKIINKLEELEKEKQEIRKEYEIIKYKYDKYVELEEQYKYMRKVKQEIYDQYKDMSSSIKEKVQKITLKINKLNKEFENKIQYFHDMEHAYKQIQSKKLLTYILNYYLEPINNMLEYFTQKILPSWTIQLKINKSVRSEPIILYIRKNKKTLSFENLSMGEKQRVVLLLLTTLDYIFLSNYEYCNVKFYDEMFDVLDNKGIELMLTLLKEFSKHSQIFIISHREISGFFDKILLVKKTNDTSVYKYIDYF